ncbi:MAG TPA: M48 family metalloprotease [Blastocatellia bacterium]|nr:M48 family metalloprotease [Blastocatellia bacterium]
MRSQNRLLALTLSLFVLSELTIGLAQAGAPPQDEPQNSSGQKTAKGSKDKPEKSGKKDDDSKAAEQAQKYNELREKAWAKYKDPSKLEFKQRVDHDYKEKRREHSEQAFKINTYNANDERTTYTGDKLTTEDTLYDNHLVQDFVNRVGQSLVPAKSLNRYAFKVVLNPLPDARSFSTGTVYISTGLLSLIDNEAQLSYILAHEISHIENNHWLEDALVYNELLDRQRSRDKTFKLIGAGASVVTGSIFGAKGGLGDGLGAALFFGPATYGILKFVASTRSFSWDTVQEDEADREGMKLMFDRNYDPREVPRLYARFQSLIDREPRLGDGFLTRSERVTERLGYLNPLIGGLQPKGEMIRGGSNLRSKRPGEADGALIAGKSIGPGEDVERREQAADKTLADLTPQLRAKLERGEILAGQAEFEMLMADLKRDNGVRAFYYDLYSMALQNLRESIQIRSDDPHAAYYYGKILQLTARTPSEKAEAMQSFVKAIDLDKRGILPGPWLHRAVGLIGDRNPSQNKEICGYLKRYVEIYQQEHGGDLPPTMDTIYEYLKTLGEETWVARPVQNTRDTEPIEAAPLRAVAPAREPGPEPAAIRTTVKPELEPRPPVNKSRLRKQ